MSFWTTLSGPARRAVVAPGSIATSISAATTKTTAIVDARRSFTQSRPLGRGEDWAGAHKSSSSSSSRKTVGRRKDDQPTFSSRRAYDASLSQRGGSGRGGRSTQILDFSTRRIPRVNNATDRFTSRRQAGVGAATGAAFAAAAAATGASHVYRHQAGAGSFLSRKKDDSSDDDDDDEDWLDRKRKPRNGVWSRTGVEAVDDADNNDDRSTLSRGQRSYDSDHDDEDDEDDDDDDDDDEEEEDEEDKAARMRRRNNEMEDEDEDADYDQKYAQQRTKDITGSKHVRAEYLYHPNVVLPALTNRYRKIHRLYITSSYKPKIHEDIKKCVEAAERLGITPIRVNKHTLNMMAENRPHAGIVLEAGPLHRVMIQKFGPVEAIDSTGQQGRHPQSQYTIQTKKSSSSSPWSSSLEPTFQCRTDEPPVWVVMDEVVDPQNMGAILRSAFFLGADGVVVCDKNSAPFSPAVAKASSGAMEARRTYTVKSLIKFLQGSKENGWQVVGAHVSYGSKRTLPLHKWPETGVDRPTILVVGNEGSGLRKMVVRQCDYLAQIPALSPVDGVVDSLNVSTAAGILLARFVGARFQHLPDNLKKFPHREPSRPLRGEKKQKDVADEEQQQQQQHDQDEKVEEVVDRSDAGADKDQK